MNYLCSLGQSMKCAVFRQAQASTRPSEHQAPDSRAVSTCWPGPALPSPRPSPTCSASGTWSCQPSALQGPPDLFVTFVLDPSMDPAVITLYQRHGRGVLDCAGVGRSRGAPPETGLHQYLT